MLRFQLQFRTPTPHLAAVAVAVAPKPLSLIRCSVSGANPNPARDRVVDFGKHRGKMLGSLPSPYLQWVSKNLRAGDTEHWARLADQVLEDPVYKDRVEWEFAEKVLNGDVLMTTPTPMSSVDALLQISERFGWDNEDKIGWSKVNFELLGTSRSGMIPRVSDKASEGGARIKKAAARKNVREEGERDKRREERRERRVKGSSGNEVSGGGGGENGSVKVDGIHSRFPGRESLLRKAMLGRRRDL
ncbi:hypothetical protein QQ045_031054 [Rhodiola kirilowii]